MRWNKTVSTGFLAVIGSLGALHLGCADIVGADFNRSFGTGGSGVSATSAPSATSATGTGGEFPCNFDPGGAAVKLEVWARDPAVPWSFGDANQGAQDFFTTLDGTPPPDPALYHTSIGTFQLYPGLGSGTDAPFRSPLYQCSTDGHHITGDPVGPCECMGYAVRFLANSTLLKEDYVLLTKIQGDSPEKTAFLVESTSFDSCNAFGAHMPDQPGCSAMDGYYGVKP